MTEKLHFIGPSSIATMSNSFLHFAKTASIRFGTLIKVVPHILLSLYTKNWQIWRLFEIFTLVPQGEHFCRQKFFFSQICQFFAYERKKM